MATGTTYGTNYTLAAAAAPSTFLDSAKWGGKVRGCTEKFVAAAAYDAGSIIYVGQVPKGAVPLFAIISTAAGVTGAVTGTIGSADDADLFGTFTTLATTSQQMLVTTAPNTPLTADTEIRIVTADDTFASAGEIEVSLFWLEHN